MGNESLSDLVPPGPETEADGLFDAVSSALRDHRDGRLTKAELRAALAYADVMFDKLHVWITGGGPLPEPWRKHYVPSDSEEGGDRG